jgi:AraC-like DNA-binding protein
MTPPPQQDPLSSAVSRSRELPFGPDGQLRPEVFAAVREAYARRSGFTLLFADEDGNLLYGMPECLQFPCRLSCRECRKEALERSIHEGHPAVCLCADQYAIWSVPVMLNQEIKGALIVVGVPAPGRPEPVVSEFESACEVLLEMAVERNLTNREYLESRRRQAAPRFPSHRDPQALSGSLAFRQYKPGLDAAETRLAQAILQEERALAREALQSIVAILRAVTELPLPILQGYATHLLSAMHEGAEAASGRFALILEHCYTSTARLLAQRTAEELFEELERSLETLLDLVHRTPGKENAGQLGRALSHMETHYGQALTRREVAQAAGVSESHLSRLIREKTGRSFTEILNRYRVDRAAQLLLRTEKNLLTIALEVGFSDQSYFGRVFRRYHGQTPDHFRQVRRSAAQT